MNAPPTAAEARTIVERSQRDPVWWVEQALGIKMWGMQRDILRSIAKHKRTSVATANGVGKSFIAAAAVLWAGTVFPESLIITTATKFTQARLVMWREITKLVERTKKAGMRPLGVEDLTTELRWTNGSVATGMTAPANDTDKFQGFRGKHTFIFVDEAPGISQEILDGVDSMLTGANTRKILLGNPTDPHCAFAESFKSPSVSKIVVSAFESPNVAPYSVTVKDIETGDFAKKVPPEGREPWPAITTAHWIRERWEDWAQNGQAQDDQRWVARVLGRFPSDTEETLIHWTWIEAAWQLFDPDAKDEPTELGIDVSDGGDDATVIAVRKGPHCRIARVIRGEDPIVAANVGAAIYSEVNAKAAKVDSCGVGAGTAARMRELGKNTTSVNVGAGSTDPERYKRLRAELWWALRERFYNSYRIVSEGLDPATAGLMYIGIEESNEVARQLNAIRWSTADGAKQIVIEEKVETKKRIKRSPDEADAIMYAFAPPAVRYGIW